MLGAHARDAIGRSLPLCTSAGKLVRLLRSGREAARLGAPAAKMRRAAMLFTAPPLCDPLNIE
jgi:hypothetical protein